MTENINKKIEAPENLPVDSSRPETISVDNPQTQLGWFLAKAVKDNKSGMVGTRSPGTDRLEIDES